VGPKKRANRSATDGGGGLRLVVRAGGEGVGVGDRSGGGVGVDARPGDERDGGVGVGAREGTGVGWANMSFG